VYDIGFRQPNLRELPGRLSATLEAATIATVSSEAPFPKEAALAELIDFFRPVLFNRSKGLGLYLARFRLEWQALGLFAKSAHGLVKHRRARGIKRRLAKRITRTARRRFWVI